MELVDIQKRQAQFLKEREWEKFHTIGNLCKAISVEAGELLEVSLWNSFSDTNEISDVDRKHLIEEVSDVLLYSLSLCNALKIDPIKSMYEKILLNEKKYPKDIFKGKVK